MLNAEPFTSWTGHPSSHYGWDTGAKQVCDIYHSHTSIFQARIFLTNSQGNKRWVTGHSIKPWACPACVCIKVGSMSVPRSTKATLMSSPSWPLEAIRSGTFALGTTHPGQHSGFHFDHLPRAPGDQRMVTATWSWQAYWLMVMFWASAITCFPIGFKYVVQSREVGEQEQLH